MIPINTLLAAYQQGLFPMAIGGRIGWFCPERRGVLPLDRLHVSKRLSRVLRRGRFRTSVNQSFGEVIAACAARPDPSGNWIDTEIIESYTALYRAGHAHSIEVWNHETLVGGLYGVSLGGAFFGESMFHRVTDASKVALCELVARLRARGYRLLDVQWLTPHLARLGAIEISRTRYLALLGDALSVDCAFEDTASRTPDGPPRAPGSS